MKLTIVTVLEDANVTIADLDAATVLDLIEEFESGISDVLHFSLDDGKCETYILRRNIVRIDVETT